MSLISDSAGIFLASDPSIGVRFQLWPDSIEDSKSVNWTDIGVIGRSEPIQAYHSSSAQKFAFTLMFVASADGSDGGTTDEMIAKVDFLKSLTYPRKVKAGYTTHPPTVWLVVGTLLNCRCVVSEVSATWTGPWEIDGETVTASSTPDDIGGDLLQLGNTPGFSREESIIGLPICARVSIVLQSARETPLDFEQVSSGGDVSFGISRSALGR